jgi:hypothetical protein
MIDVAKVDVYNPEANMYGCLPCPKCRSVFRYVTRKSGLITCDDCGFTQKPSNEFMPHE